jgi:hypothetical protein
MHPTRLLLLAALLTTSNLRAETPGRLLSVDATRTTARELGAVAAGAAAGALVHVTALRDAGDRPLTLALEVAPLFAADFRLYVDGRRRAAAAVPLVFLRGTAEQWPRSSEALTVDVASGRVDGYLATSEGVQQLSAPADASKSPLAAALAARSLELETPAGWLANDVVESPGQPLAVSLAASKRTIAAPGAEYEARIAIESDFEFFATIGGEAEAQAYLARSLHGISELYFRQLGVALRIESISLWATAADPWQTPAPHSVVGSPLLCEFASYWQKHRRSTTAFPRDAALFFTGKTSSDHGGQAFLGTLCNYKARPSACPAGAYGTIIVTKREAWDHYVIAHELGHTFGSPHTHCYQPPVDECYTDERGCFAGGTSAPGDGGSVMSYCRQTTLSLGEPDRFGLASERVPARIRGFVDSVAGPACLVRTNDPYALAIEAAAGGATLTWADPFAGESSWLVERRLPNGKFKQVLSLPANTTAIDIAPLAAGEHVFRLRAKVKKDFSDYSAAVAVNVP